MVAGEEIGWNKRNRSVQLPANHLSMCQFYFDKYDVKHMFNHASLLTCLPSPNLSSKCIDPTHFPDLLSRTLLVALDLFVSLLVYNAIYVDIDRSMHAAQRWIHAKSIIRGLTLFPFTYLLFLFLFLFLISVSYLALMLYYLVVNFDADRQLQMMTCLIPSLSMD